MNPELARVVYLSDTAADVATYKRLPLPPVDLGAEATLTGAGATGAGDVLIAAFVSPACGLDVWPAGTWTFSLFAKVSDATDTTQIKVKLYQRTLAGTETLLLTATSAEINNTTVGAVTISGAVGSDTATAETDRIVVKVYHLTNSAVSKTTTLYLAGQVNQSRVLVPFGVPIGNADMFRSLYDPDGDGIIETVGPQYEILQDSDGAILQDSDKNILYVEVV